MNKAAANNQALVVASYGSRGYLETSTGKRQRFVLKGRKLRPVCGDQVIWQEQSTGNEALLSEVLPRSNVLNRPDSRGKPEPLAANLSRLIVVLAAEPAPDFFIADRYLCAAEMLPADAALIWNKTDLGFDSPKELEVYRRLGYRVLETSSKDGTGIDELKKMLGSGINMLAGQSGVGKSSLINALVPDAEVVTGELSASSREGRHTTTASVIHTLDNAGRLIDTPGVREFAPAIEDPNKIQSGFREILSRAEHCRFSNCQHLREPNCAVKEALAAEEISARRYESYKRLVNTASALIKQNAPG